VYRQHAALVLRALRRLGVREADLEDLAQEVFLVVHDKLSGFEGRSALATWVYGICVRVAAGHRRKAFVSREQGLSHAPERASSGEHAVRTIALKQARQQLDGLLDELDDDKRAVFVLYELEQMPMHDVALAVEVPEQTAWARLYAARKHIETGVARAKEAHA